MAIFQLYFLQKVYTHSKQKTDLCEPLFLQNPLVEKCSWTSRQRSSILELWAELILIHRLRKLAAEAVEQLDQQGQWCPQGCLRYAESQVLTGNCLKTVLSHKSALEHT